MADLSALQDALVKADAAGNTDDARALAAEIVRMRGPAASSPSQPTSNSDGLALLRDEIANPQNHPGANEPAPTQPTFAGVRAMQNAPPVDVGRLLSNIPSSAANTVVSMAQPFIHPIDTASNMADVAAGVWGKLGNPNVSTAQKSKAEAIGDALKNRYGTIDAARNTMETDPVGMAADVSTASAGVSKLANFLNGGGQDAARLARSSDPVAAMSDAAKKGVTNIAEPVVSNTLGIATGTGPNSIRTAFNAGQEGGGKAEAFLNQLRGNESPTAVVDAAKNAVAQLYKDRSAQYQAGIGSAFESQKPLDFQPIVDSLNDIGDVGTFKGQVINQSTTPIFDKLKAAVQNWKGLDPAEYHTAEGLDAFKKQIGDIRDTAEFGSPSRKIADSVYNAVKTQITDQAPEYASVMRDYSNATDQLDQLQKGLSLGNRSTADQALRKLQSIMRDNANTNYGARAEMGRTLEAAGAKNLMPQIAGQMLSSSTPRGLYKVGPAGIAGLSLALSNPGALAAMPLTSPRLVGEGAYYAGKGASLAGALGKYGSLTSIDPTTARMLAVQLGRLDQQNQQ